MQIVGFLMTRLKWHLLKKECMVNFHETLTEFNIIYMHKNENSSKTDINNKQQTELAIERIAINKKIEQQREC